jgi:hypothetical protein
MAFIPTSLFIVSRLNHFSNGMGGSFGHPRPGFTKIELVGGGIVDNHSVHSG